MTEFADRVSGIGALAEPVRRELYLYVCAQHQLVGREQVADAVGVAHHKVKFHLDRLVDEGLLEVEFARLSGKEGPGAGRTAKLYRRATTEVAVSLPERQYALAGKLMAQAIEDSATSGLPVLEALNLAAAEHGAAMGRAALERRGASTPAEALDIACATLAAHGYEPQAENDRVVLANCPFHALTEGHPDMVCGMNFALINAMVHTLDPDTLESHLDAAPGRCCVTLALRGGTT